MEKVEKFIADNAISLTGSGSNLNANCTVLSGFALHAGVNDVKELISITQGFFPKVETSTYVDELTKVFNFAKDKGYGSYWKTPEASRMYRL